MKRTGRVVADRDSEVTYHQFARSRLLVLFQAAAGALTWPLILPLALFSRLSDFVFRTMSEMLSLLPYLLGIIVRSEFYRWALTSCGRNVTIGFGTVLFYRDITIGDHVAIGNFNIIHHCDFGSFVLIADGCQFLSGKHYHTTDRTDIPMAIQGGRLRRITVGDDTWVGAGSIVMADISTGAVIGAGSVVTKPVDQFVIAAGNPAATIRKRV